MIGTISGSSANPVVSLGNASNTFTLTNGSYVNNQGDGATLTSSAGGYVYTTSAGLIARYGSTVGSSASVGLGLIYELDYPDGTLVSTAAALGGVEAAYGGTMTAPIGAPGAAPGLTVVAGGGATYALGGVISLVGRGLKFCPATAVRSALSYQCGALCSLGCQCCELVWLDAGPPSRSASEMRRSGDKLASETPIHIALTGVVKVTRPSAPRPRFCLLSVSAEATHARIRERAERVRLD